MKISKTGAALIAAGVVLAAGQAMAQEAYKVGMTGAVTGAGSGSNAPAIEGIKIYIDELNAKGGINGHPVELIIQDDQAEPSKAAANAKKLLNQDKVVLMLNASLSSTYAPVVAESARAGVPLLFATGVCPQDVFPPAKKLQFCTTGYAASLDAEFGVNWLKQTAKGQPKIAMVSMAIPVSRQGVEHAEKVAKELGMQVVSNDSVPPPTPDYTPFASRAKDAGAEWMFSWAPWVTQVKMLEALRKLGWTGDGMGYAHINAEDDLVRLADPKFHVFGTNSMLQENAPVHQQILAAAKKHNAQYPATQHTEGWVAAMVIEAALKKAGWPADAEKVAAAMNDLTVDLRGLRGGPLQWTAENHFRTKQYYRVYRWDEGKKAVAMETDWTAVDVK